MTVVLAKILYASPCSLVGAGGLPQLLICNELSHFVRRGVWLGLYRASDPALTQLIADNDDNLFWEMLYSEHHVYFLTRQIISITLDNVVVCLTVKNDDRNFVIRQFKDIYNFIL